MEKTLPPREAIFAFFEEIIERSLKDKNRKGCMLVNSALELAPHDKEFERVVAGVLDKIEKFFRRLIEAGQKDGTITTHCSADDLARVFLSILLGIRVLARARPERSLLEGIANPALALLDCKLGASQ
jgi:TetR/AcrR family transcriptional repressor of nem operon